jgi:hypothetical protein
MVFIVTSKRAEAKVPTPPPQPKEVVIMGQQQTVTVAGSAVRRMILALTVAAVMAAMMVIIANPAFARGNQPYGGSCEDGAFNAYQNIGTGLSGNGKAPYGLKGPGQEHGEQTAEAQTNGGPHCQ